MRGLVFVPRSTLDVAAETLAILVSEARDANGLRLMLTPPLPAESSTPNLDLKEKFEDAVLLAFQSITGQAAMPGDCALMALNGDGTFSRWPPKDIRAMMKPVPI